MLITIILKIEKLITIGKKMKSRTLFEISITHTEALMVTEPYMRIFVVKDTISVD